MATTLLQTANAGDCAAALYCSGASGTDADAVSREIATDGSDTTILGGHNLSNTDDDLVNYAWVYDAEASGYDFASGDWTVELEVTTADDQIWTKAYVCRVNSGCTNQETLASITGLGVSLNSTGNKTSGTFNQASSVTPDPGDKIVVLCIFDANQPHGNSSVSLRLHTTNGITAPGTEVVPTENINVKHPGEAIQEIW